MISRLGNGCTRQIPGSSAEEALPGERRPRKGWAHRGERSARPAQYRGGDFVGLVEFGQVAGA